MLFNIVKILISIFFLLIILLVQFLILSIGKASNTIYYYRVRLVSDMNGWSNVVAVLTLPVPPDVYNPIGIRDGSFIASWESIENALEYELEVMDVDDMNVSLSYSSYDTIFFVAGLSSGGTYNYRARVRNGSGWSEYSESS